MNATIRINGVHKNLFIHLSAETHRSIRSTRIIEAPGWHIGMVKVSGYQGKRAGICEKIMRNAKRGKITNLTAREARRIKLDNV